MLKLNDALKNEKMNNEKETFINSLNCEIRNIIISNFGVKAIAPFFKLNGQGNYSLWTADEEITDLLKATVPKLIEESDPYKVNVKGNTLYLNEKNEIEQLPYAREFDPMKLTGFQIKNIFNTLNQFGSILDSDENVIYIFKNRSIDLPKIEELSKMLLIPEKRFKTILQSEIPDLKNKFELKEEDPFQTDQQKAYKINFTGIEPLCKRYEVLDLRGNHFASCYLYSPKSYYFIAKEYFVAGSKELRSYQLELTQANPIRSLGKFIGMEPMKEESFNILNCI